MHSGLLETLRTTVLGLALLGLLGLSMSCQGSRAVPAARPPQMSANDGETAASASDATCDAPADCQLVWTPDDPCGECGTPRRGHVEALNAAGANARRAETGGCPACAVPEDPSLLATCTAGRCEAVDLLASELTRCDTHADCTIAVAGCTCTPTYFVGVRRGEERHLAERYGCAPASCPAASQPMAYCAGGHCNVPPPPFGGYAPDAPEHVAVAEDEPHEPWPDPLPASGVLDGCTVTLGEPELWRSWMYSSSAPSAGPDQYSHLMTAVRVEVRCDPARSHVLLATRGWIVAEGRDHAVEVMTLAGATNTPWYGMVPDTGSIDLRVHFGEGPFLPEGTPARAVIRFTTSSGATLTLSSAAGRVAFAS